MVTNQKTGAVVVLIGRHIICSKEVDNQWRTVNTNGNPQTWGLMPGLDRRFGWKWKWKWHCHRSVSKVGQFSCLCFPSNQLLDCLRSSTYRSSSPASPIPHYQCWLGRKCIIRTQPSISLPSSQVCWESWTPVAPSSYASHVCFLQVWASTLMFTLQPLVILPWRPVSL